MTVLQLGEQLRMFFTLYVLSARETGTHWREHSEGQWGWLKDWSARHTRGGWESRGHSAWRPSSQGNRIAVYKYLTGGKRESLFLPIPSDTTRATNWNKVIPFKHKIKVFFIFFLCACCQMLEQVGQKDCRVFIRDPVQPALVDPALSHRAGLYIPYASLPTSTIWWFGFSIRQSRHHSSSSSLVKNDYLHITGTHCISSLMNAY